MDSEAQKMEVKRSSFFNNLLARHVLKRVPKSEALVACTRVHVDIVEKL